MRDVLRVGISVGYITFGAVALVLSVGQLGAAPSPLVLVFSGLLPAALVLTLVVSGGWLAFWSDLTLPEFRRVTLWSLAGLATFGSLALAFVVATDGQYELLRPELLVAETVVGGALAGLGIGVYDVLSDRQRTQLVAERERLDVLNRMLRHHMLNGMNIILASAEELDRRGESPTREVRTIQRRGTEVAALVERVSDLTDRIEEQPEPKPRSLETLVAGPVSRAQAAYGTRNVHLDDTLPAVEVLGDETLREAVETVVFERAQVSDGIVIDTEVTPSDVVVRIRDDIDVPTATADGGGARAWGPFADRADAAGADDETGGSERYAASLNQGVDIYMAELLLSRSGGRLEVVPGQHSVVELHLPRA